MPVGLVEHPENASIKRHSISPTWAAAVSPTAVGGRGSGFIALTDARSPQQHYSDKGSRRPDLAPRSYHPGRLTRKQHHHANRDRPSRIANLMGNAHRINQGLMPDLTRTESGDFHFVDAVDPEDGIARC